MSHIGKGKGKEKETDNVIDLTVEGKGKETNTVIDRTVKGKENLPWIEKYRPTSLDDVYGQEEIISTVRQFIQSKQLPHLLFYGPPGTGKTSTIIAIAREIYGPHYKNMILELNASDDRGIDVVRNQIKNFASTMQLFSRGFKLIVLDEADAMTNVAQNALRRVIEKYTSHTRFCILANYAHKLNPALLSRCTRFRFAPLSLESVCERVDDVIEKENINIEQEAKESIVALSKGDMRKALNVLQACFAAVDDGASITTEMVYECVGSPHPLDTQRIVDTLTQDDWTTAFNTIQKIKQLKGLALIDILQEIAEEFEELEMKPAAKISLLKGLAEIEYAISKGGTDKIQTSATIGVVKGSLELLA